VCAHDEELTPASGDVEMVGDGGVKAGGALCVEFPSVMADPTDIAASLYADVV